jgi:hypothetical protein
MHGAPATAAEGCHGAMSAPAAMGGYTSARTAPAEHGAMVHPGGVRAGAPAEMRGELCVSTAARQRLLPPAGGGLLAVVAVLAAVLLVSRPPVSGRPGRRGPPPPGGRSLLLQMCIART